MAAKPARQHYIPQFLLKNFSYKDKRKEIFRLNCRSGKIEKRSIRDTACGDGIDPRKQLWGREFESSLGKKVENSLYGLVKQCCRTDLQKEPVHGNFIRYTIPLNKNQQDSLLQKIFLLFFSQRFLLSLENFYVSKNEGDEKLQRENFRDGLAKIIAETELVDTVSLISPPKGGIFVLPDCFTIPFPHKGREEEFYKAQTLMEKSLGTTKTEADILAIYREYICKQWNAYELLIFPLSAHRALFIFNKNAQKHRVACYPKGCLSYANSDIFLKMMTIDQVNAQAMSCAYHNEPFYVYAGHKAKLGEYYKFVREKQLLGNGYSFQN